MEWLKNKASLLDLSREADRLKSLQCTDRWDKEELAADGFYYSTKDRYIICAWCEQAQDLHVECKNCFKENVPIAYEEVIPRKNSE